VGVGEYLTTKNCCILLILLQIMEEEFLKDVSWTAGFGMNSTAKLIILSNFKNVVSLLRGDISFI
jgi:hypothetical protein